jgi:glycerol-3-phosphate dehydrogenase (NAD(P)+)
VAQIAILGAGSWGTALAIHLARVGHDVRLWSRDVGLARDLARSRTTSAYLPGLPLPNRVTPTASIPEALDRVDLVVCAVPSHGYRAVIRAAAPCMPRNAIIVSATKGLEGGSLLRMSEVIAAEASTGHAVVVLSGPSFAIEVAQEQPTAVLAASVDAAAAERVQTEFRGPQFRIYASSDVVGVELAGALKNVIAIAAGVVQGLGLGHNALAGLITRGLAEISRLTCAAGGRRETPAGLSGLGDLVLTCTGSLSRNRRVGLELASGRALEDILGGMRMVAEGVRTTAAALALAQRYGVELPIATQIREVLEGRSDVRAAIEALMLRPQRAEGEVASRE